MCVKHILLVSYSISCSWFQIKAKSEPVTLEKNLECFEYPMFNRMKTGCTIFLGYTSNMISCGIREIIRFLVQHNMVKNICFHFLSLRVPFDFLFLFRSTVLSQAQVVLKKISLNV